MLAGLSMLVPLAYLLLTLFFLNLLRFYYICFYYKYYHFFVYFRSEPSDDRMDLLDPRQLGCLVLCVADLKQFCQFIVIDLSEREDFDTLLGYSSFEKLYNKFIPCFILI